MSEEAQRRLDAYDRDVRHAQRMRVEWARVQAIREQNAELRELRQSVSFLFEHLGLKPASEEATEEVTA